MNNRAKEDQLHSGHGIKRSRLVMAIAAAALGGSMGMQSALAVSIDEFTANQDEIETDGGSVKTSTLDTGTVVGGERDMYVEKTGGDGNVRSDVSGGQYHYSQDSAGTTGMAKVQWDGNDNDADNLDTNGLSLDLTGTSKFILGLVFNDPGVSATTSPVTLRVYTGGNTEHTLTKNLVFKKSNGTLDIEYPYSDFSPRISDPSDVTAIEMIIDGTNSDNEALDIDIDYLRTDQPPPPALSCKDKSFSGVPADPSPGDTFDTSIVISTEGSGQKVQKIHIEDAMDPVLNIVSEPKVDGNDLPGACTFSGLNTNQWSIDCTNGIDIPPNTEVTLTYTTQVVANFTGTATNRVTDLRGKGAVTQETVVADDLSACQASISRRPQNVPAISAWGLGASLLLLPLAGGFFARRRRR